MSREQLFAAFFLAVYAFLLYQLFLFLSPYAAPLIWAGILALTFYPLTSWLVRIFRGSRGLAAFVLVTVVVVIAIGPSILLGSMLVHEAAEAYGRVQEMVARGEITRLTQELTASRVGRLFERLLAPFQGHIEIDPAKIALGAAGFVSQQLATQSGALARNVLVTIVNSTLMVVALFFFFRDGERMADRVRDLLPMERAHTDLIFQRLYNTLSAVVQSMVLVAIAQGILGGFGYWLIGGLPFAVFLGFLTALASIIPPAGSAFVWVPAAFYLWLTGETARAIGILLWGVLAISMADNIIRTLVIGGRAKLPTFLLLFAILGGLNVYGLLGIFLAPLIVAALLSFTDIYRTIYGGQAVTVVEDSGEREAV